MLLPHITLVPGKIWLPDVLLAASYLLAGYDVIKKAWRNLLRGRALDENFLMTTATFGAAFLHQYSEAAGVMLFYQIGEFFQSYAVNKSRRSVAALMDIRPDYANLRQGGELVRVVPEKVKTGDVIVVKPGERVPLDGEVVKGVSLVDTAAITGESLPREIEPGAELISGCINLSGVLEVRVSREYGQSTVAKILDLVENAGSKKARVEQFITRFARWYTPTVVALALLIALIPPLLVKGALWSDWTYRALTFLVISCPCALVISVPLSFFGGIGAASKQGILVKGSNYLQALAEAEIVVFDKTGTLTKGSFEVAEIFSPELPPEKVLELAAYAGAFSSHPVSQSIRRSWGKELETVRISEFEELAARGVCASVDGRKIGVGNARLMKEMAVEVPTVDAAGTVVYICAGGRFAGWIKIADEIKTDAVEAIHELKRLGIKQTVMLTGDNHAAGTSVGLKLGLDRVYADLLPGQKVELVEQLMGELSPNGKLIFAGDGINDAPVLARADVGIAMGGIGSDAAVEAADAVIMTDEPSKIAAAIRISQGTLRIVKQNIIFAIGVKLAVLALGAFGLATMWEAVFADVGVTVIAILNAIRTLRFKG